MSEHRVTCLAGVGSVDKRHTSVDKPHTEGTRRGAEIPRSGESAGGFAGVWAGQRVGARLKRSSRTACRVAKPAEAPGEGLWMVPHTPVREPLIGVPGVHRIATLWGERTIGIPEAPGIHTPIPDSSAVPGPSDSLADHHPSSPHHLIGTVWTDHVRGRNTLSVLLRVCDPAAHQFASIPHHQFTNDLKSDPIRVGGPVRDDQTHLGTRNAGLANAP